MPWLESSVAINEYMGSGAIDPFQVVYLAFDVSWFLIGYIMFLGILANHRKDKQKMV